MKLEDLIDARPPSPLCLRGGVFIQGTMGAYHVVGRVEVCISGPKMLPPLKWATVWSQEYSLLDGVDLYKPHARGHESWYEALASVLAALEEPVAKWRGVRFHLPRIGDAEAFKLTYQIEENPARWRDRTFRKPYTYHPDIPQSRWPVGGMRAAVTYARGQGWTTPCADGTWLHRLALKDLEVKIKVAEAQGVGVGDEIRKVRRAPGVDYIAWMEQLGLDPAASPYPCLSPAFAAATQARAASRQTLEAIKGLDSLDSVFMTLGSGQ